MPLSESSRFLMFLPSYLEFYSPLHPHTPDPKRALWNVVQILLQCGYQQICGYGEFCEGDRL